MDKKIEKKLSALDPRFRKKISDLFASIHESVSMLYDVATHDEKTGLYNNNLKCSRRIFYIFTSTSTPAGSSRCIRESIVWLVGFKISIILL